MIKLNPIQPVISFRLFGKRINMFRPILFNKKNDQLTVEIAIDIKLRDNGPFKFHFYW